MGGGRFTALVSMVITPLEELVGIANYSLCFDELCQTLWTGPAACG